MDRLDNYLLEVILCKLQLKDLLSCSATNKQLNSIVTSSTIIQLFLHNHLFGRSSPLTPDHMVFFKYGSARTPMEELLRSIKSERNLLDYRPCIMDYKLPEGQIIVAVADKYIITSIQADSDYPIDKNGLYALLTLWEIDGENINGKAVKVNFKPQREGNTRAVDIKDDVIVCVEGIEEGHNTRYRIRVFHLFNEGEVAQPRESDEVIRNTRDMGLNNCPRVSIGREGLLVVQTAHDIKWTRWTEGKEATWGRIEKHPYLGFSSHLEIYGSDMIAMLGPCAPETPVSTSTAFGGFPSVPVEKDYLLLYKLSDADRSATAKAQVILRMPCGENEYNLEVRDEVPLEESDETMSPGRLINSSNARSEIIQVAFVVAGRPPDLHIFADHYCPWITLAIPVRCIRDALEAAIRPADSAAQGDPTQITDNPDRMGQISRAITRRASTDLTTQLHEQSCECCPKFKARNEQFRGVTVLGPEKWLAGAFGQSFQAPDDAHENPWSFGTRHANFDTTFDWRSDTIRTTEFELMFRNYNCHEGHEGQRCKALGGLGDDLGEIGDKDEQVSRAAPQYAYKYRLPHETGHIHAPLIHSGGQFPWVSTHGLVNNVFFDGEKVVLRYKNGWMTVFDFA
ncbi:uncharacterized protein I303_106263 [Kwoniella dejecticola CBS 10117]|uniref:F-box domain-containing protein n=1 Tax=Kwoniella dejecticola CBS 10117 TaxID=1296121 RepID=A0A1A6A1R8_9TREE|nr:uncharacterized protein I303_06282 [Kwoniella dejecticola CBS 10117]OBR83995.1 hypothetical protein I303_06282 [Kwoniella dejecticola CBS 10117]